MESKVNEITDGIEEIREDTDITETDDAQKVENMKGNSEPRVFDSYDEMIKRLKDDVKNLKKIKKQQKKILKLEEKRKEVLNDIERKREIERKLKERDKKRHKKH